MVVVVVPVVIVKVMVIVTDRVVTDRYQEGSFTRDPKPTIANFGV